MLKVWDADNFRRTLAGLALFVAPLAMMVSEVIYSLSFSQESDGRFFAAVAERSATWTGATLLGLLAAILFVPAVVGMVHLTRDRGVVLAHVGGALALVGAVGYACHQMLFVVMGEMARIEGQREAVISISRQLDNSAIIGMIAMLMFLLSLSLGLILLTAGLYRAGFAPVWVPICVFLSILPAFVPVDSDYPGYAAFVLLAMGLGAVGVKVLAISDADWGRGRAPVGDVVGIGARARVQ
jgi:hypothetical protein